MDKLDNRLDVPNDKYNGIKGWLIFPIIALFSGALKFPLNVVSRYVPILKSDVLRDLSTPGTVNYSPFWVPFIVFETIISIALGALCIAALVFLFRRKKVLPKLMKILFLTYMCFGLFELIALKLLYSNIDIVSKIDTVQLIAMLAGPIIWFLYFTYSKRVKATFVR